MFKPSDNTLTSASSVLSSCGLSRGLRGDLLFRGLFPLFVLIIKTHRLLIQLLLPKILVREDHHEKI